MRETFIFKLLTIIISVFIFVGCANFPSKSNAYRGQPYWLSHPSGAGYTGGVGYSGEHVRGKSGQRELAVARAIDDIARQLSIKVDSVGAMETMGTTGGNSFSSMSIYSVHTVTGASFSAKIMDVWENGLTGELFIYMRMID